MRDSEHVIRAAEGSDLYAATGMLLWSTATAISPQRNFFQSLAGTHSITVATSNGDSVVLENVTEGRRKQEIIWELVRGESPERLQADNKPASNPTNG